MRTTEKGQVADHTLLADVGVNDHHRQGTFYTVIINSQTIPPGAYQLRTALGGTGHKTIRAMLRGSISVGTQGHCGAFALGSDVAAQSVGMSSVYSAYTYMGCFSRLHGDTKLSETIFGSSIYLRDIYIDGSDGVLEFYNSSGTNQALMVYGTISVK
jgi:hypothetical protein